MDVVIQIISFSFSRNFYFNYVIFTVTREFIRLVVSQDVWFFSSCLDHACPSFSSLSISV